MREQLENELYQIDPIFFEHAIACKEEKENEMHTCMAFGCECGDGWFEPLKKFVQKIAIINKLAKEYNTKIVCDQIKQKFGEIRIYYSTLWIDESKKDNNINAEQINILNEMVDEAYNTCIDKCWNVCEWCGADGGYNGENLITTSGWVSRICKKCAKDKAETETKHYDEYHQQEYVPRITWFHDGYEFLNPYHVAGFEYKYNLNYYYSIIEAFYCEKDPEHKNVYNKIIRDNQFHNAYTMEYIAQNVYGIRMEESDYELLKDIVKAKFSYQYNKNIKNELIETGDKLLQNMGRHHNNIFGYCICDKCKNKEHKDLYAKMLMEIRNELKLNK